MRKSLLIVAALFVAFGAAAQAGQYKIEMVSKGFQHDFWKQVNLGSQAAGEEFGADVNFVGPDSESNISQQVEQLANAVNKRPDAICFAALDREASLDIIDQAAGAKIPVITFDSDIGEDTSGAVRAFVATDNMQAGAGAADAMFEKLGAKLTGASETVTIAVLAQDSTSQSVGDRTKGFIDRMVELCGAAATSVEGHVKYEKIVANPKVVVAVGIPAEVIDSQAITVAQTLFNRPNILGIFGSNEFAAKAIVNTDETLGMLGPDKVIGIGFDAGALQKTAVADRVLYGGIAQNPFQIGYLSVKTAIEAIKGQKVGDIAVPFYFYTADNMKQPEIAACLYD